MEGERLPNEPKARHLLTGRFLTEQVFWKERLERMRDTAERYDSLEGVVQVDELLDGINQMAVHEDDV